tara:strand:- start:2523 stop:2978 length:456 start_codon:yes stop_codon:yes gene_type:complete
MATCARKSVLQKGNETRTGRVGELIAASAIERYGGDPTIVRTDGYDIVAFLQDKYFRIDVKARAVCDQSKSYQFIVGKGAKSKRLMTTHDADAVVLVAVDKRLVMFKHVKEMTGRTMRIAARHFTQENERSSFQLVMMEDRSSAFLHKNRA